MSKETLPQKAEVEERAENTPKKKSGKAKKKRPFFLRFLLSLVIITTLILLFIISLPSIISSDFASKKILPLINSKIPGTIAWSDLVLQPVRGNIALTDFYIITPENDTALHFDTLRLRYSFSELFEKKVHVKELALIRPHADISIEKDGKINIVSAFLDSLPAPKEKEPKAPKEPQELITELPIDIIIDTVSIDSLSLAFRMEAPSLEVRLNELNIGVNASLFPIRAESNIDLRALTYSDPDRSFTLNSLDLFAGVNDFSVDSLSLDLRTDNDSLLLTGSVSDFISDTISTDLTLNTYLAVKTVSTLTGQDIGRGGFSLEAHLSDKVNNPTLEGNFRYGGPQLSGVKINHISVPLSLKNRTLSVSPLSLKVMDDITLDASLSVELKKLFPQGFLKEMAELSGLSYSAKAELKAPKIPGDKAPLVNSFVKLSLNGNGTDPEKLNLDLKLDAGTEAVRKKSNIPLTLAGIVKMNSGIVHIDTGALQVNSIPVLSFLGDVNLKEKLLDLQGNMQKTDLSLFNPFIPGDVKIGGNLGFDITTAGALTAPAINLLLKGEQIEAKAFPLGDLNLSLRTTPDSGSVEATCSLLGEIASLELATQADLFTPGSFSLKESPAVSLDLSNGKLHLSPATKGVVKADADFSAAYSGWLNSGSGNLNFSMGKLTTDQATVDAIDLVAEIKDSLITVNSIRISLYDSAEIAGTASYHLNGNYSADISSDTLDPGSFVSVLPEQLATSILLKLNGRGSVTSPSLDVDLSVPVISWENVALGTQDVALKLRSKELALTGTGLADLAVDYNLTSTRFEAAAVVDSFLLAPVAAIAKQELIAGVVTADIYAKGSTKALDTVHAEIPLLSVTMDSLNLISGEKIAASYGNNGLKIDSLHISLLDTGKIDIRGTFSKDERMDFSGDIDIPLVIAERFTSDIEQITGSIAMKGDLSGTVKHPKGLGNISFKDVSLLVTESQQKLHKVSGEINVSNSGVKVDQFTAYIDDGYVRANGAINLQSKKVTSGDFKMDIVNLPINVPNTMDLRLGGNISVSADKKYQGIVGTIELLECYFYQYIDPLPPLSSQPKRTAVKTKKDTSPLDDVNLNLKIIPRQNIMVDNNLAYFDIKPELAISGKLTNPSVEGRMNVVTGILNYLNREFTVRRGVIDFVNPYEIAPEVDIIAETTIDDWDITIQVDGTVGEELRYVSTSKPPLADNQILSLILTGKLSEDFDSQEFLMSQLAAAALDNLNSSMDIELSTSGMKIGEELSRRLYTEYSMGMVEGEMQQLASVLVKLFDQLRVRGYASTTGDAGGEVEFNVKIR